uniref:uncharacterized protein LOC131142058 n=1 Tax=Doryrhamphus excisus TaxID=161450 RepID=UPI0025AE3C3D|nr:uncharacterized protein LOC131142058 [Doryrhamphus excisus]
MGSRPGDGHVVGWGTLLAVLPACGPRNTHSWMTPVEGAPRLPRVVRVGWKNSTNNRTQDNFRCPVWSVCQTANITLDCDPYQGPHAWSMILRTGCNVTVEAEASLCRLTGNPFLTENPFTFREDVSCSSTNGTQWTVTSGDTDIWISNSTEIMGRRSTIWVILVVPQHQQVTHPTLVPIVTSCTHMAYQMTHNEIHWEIRLPSIPTCKPRRNKRAWYDTLLGGAHIIDAYLGWNIDIWDATSEVLHNVRIVLNSTKCTLQMLNAKVQQERLLRTLTSSAVQLWRHLWNISDRVWLQVKPSLTQCNETHCQGMWLEVNVTRPMTICRYRILPLIVGNHYYFLKTHGDWFSPQTNLTYDLEGCDVMDKGTVCLQMQIYRDPCFTNDTALCDWNVEKPEDLLYQVGPHSICVATVNPHPQLPTTPFSGCLWDVHLFTWHNQSFRLTNFSWTNRLSTVQWQALSLPWRVDLTRFSSALNRSETLKHLVKTHLADVSRLQVSTMIARNEVVHAARTIEQSSAHHWWDVFAGMSITARQHLAPPLLVLIICLALMTLLNCCMFWYIRRTRAILSRRIYNAVS